MGRIKPDDLAAHIAARLDGDYDDGLDAYVSASAVGNGFHIGLSDDDGKIGAYRVMVEQIE